MPEPPGRVRRAGDVVVARVPDHVGVVAQHAQLVRRLAALAVDVVDVVPHARRVEQLLVLVEVRGPASGDGFGWTPDQSSSESSSTGAVLSVTAL